MATIGTVSYGLGLYPDSAYQTEVTIEAIEVFDDQGNVKGVAFKLTNTDGVADLRGLFFDVAGETITSTTNDDAYPFNFSINSVEQSVDKVYDSLGAPLNWNVTQIATGENLVSNLKGGLNVNGAAQNQGDIPDQDFYDMGIEFGTSGIGQGDDISTSQFFVSGITLQDLDDQYFAVRLTSTDDPQVEGIDREGSLKLVGQFDIGGDGEDPVYEGLSPGYWKNWSLGAPGNQVNDWNEDPIIFNNEDLAMTRGEDVGYRMFEHVFGVDAGDWLISPRNEDSDVTLLQALQLGGDLKGDPLKKNALARQATAALLNSFERDESDANGAVNYRFDADEVISWTKLALTESSEETNASDWEDVGGLVAAMNIPGLDTSSWNTQQATIYGLADLFVQNNNLGLYA